MSSRSLRQKPRLIKPSRASCKAIPKAYDNPRHPLGGVPQDAPCARERPSLTAERGLRGDEPAESRAESRAEGRAASSQRRAAVRGTEGREELVHARPQ